jgi:hypothetical protein
MFRHFPFAPASVRRSGALACWASACLVIATCPATAQENDAKKQPAAESPSPATAAKPQNVTPDDAGLVRLSKEDAVWMDAKRKLVVADGEVVLREGFLEMFACTRGTKEHESIIAVDSKAYLIHTGLLAVGAEPGRPVQFDPVYRPVQGPIVDIYVLWRDAKGGKHTARAQDWVRNTKTQKPMEQDWIFGGSGFWTDEETGKKHYYAEEGDLICLSNFSTAMLDVPIASSQSSDQLLFEALTENIPPKGTKVRLVLIPRQEKKKEQPAPEKPAPKTSGS